MIKTRERYPTIDDASESQWLLSHNSKQERVTSFSAIGQGDLIGSCAPLGCPPELAIITEDTPHTGYNAEGTQTGTELKASSLLAFTVLWGTVQAAGEE